jgi:hypothetical protein
MIMIGSPMKDDDWLFRVAAVPACSDEPAPHLLPGGGEPIGSAQSSPGHPAGEHHLPFRRLFHSIQPCQVLEISALNWARRFTNICLEHGFKRDPNLIR